MSANTDSSGRGGAAAGSRLPSRDWCGACSSGASFLGVLRSDGTRGGAPDGNGGVPGCRSSVGDASSGRDDSAGDGGMLTGCTGEERAGETV